MPSTDTLASSQLKQQTASAHRGLDTQPLLRELLSPQLTLARYVEALTVFYGFYSDYESLTLRRCAGLGLDLQVRRKLPSLERDFAALGTSLPSRQSVGLGVAIADQDQALGMLYVMEGSTLGGQVIARCLSQSLGLTESHGVAYFHSYGSAVVPRWQETQAALNAFQAHGGSVQQMVATAILAFTDLESRLKH